ncbi:MAG: hypothetical protein HQK99_05075 [Nitrospirae bacterium]|nr:hypothetical protein [Nitrospirota bacterium]
MDDLANENNPLRLDIEGGEVYLPFAQHKLREMKSLMAMRGITVDNRRIDADDAAIFVQSIPGMDYIRITGTPPIGRIMLIFIRDTSKEQKGDKYRLVYNTSGDNNGKDYRALRYRLDGSGNAVDLNPDGMMGDELTISDTGLTLNVQSGDGVYAAELPSIFVYNEMIDYAEFEPTSWSSILLVLNQLRIVGSRYVGSWAKTQSDNQYTQSDNQYKYTEDTTQFTPMPGSRHPFTSGSDGYITACMFKNQQTSLGTGVMYRELSVVPEDKLYSLWKNEIAYKAAPEDSGYITGMLIGNDYITGTPWQTGYNWMTYQVIDVFDKDNALVKIVSNVIPMGETIQRPFTLTLVVSNRWYLDRTPPVFYTTTDTWVYNGKTAINETACKRIEKLVVGGLEIETTDYEESVSDSSGFYWVPGAIPAMTLQSQSGDAHGGYGDGAIAATGSISGPGKFNASLKVETFFNTATGRENVRWLPISIGEQHDVKKTGYRDIHVTAFDNSNGADYFIIIYKKSYVYYTASSDTPNANDGTIPAPVTEEKTEPTVITYSIAYKIKGGFVIKTNLTGDIRATSCQINNGYMAYTYCTFEGGAFSKRTIGTIDMATGTKTEWETDDIDDRLSGFKHFHYAAIGVL